jgi:Bbp16
MIVDALLLLSDAQAVSATGFSTNTIDLSLPTVARDIAVGESMEVNFQVDVAADTASGDETYTFQFVQSANANLSSPDVLAQTAIARATLVAGFTFTLPLPENVINKRYIGVQYTLGGTTPSITVTAMLQPQSMSSLAKPQTYAKGYTIS